VQQSTEFVLVINVTAAKAFRPAELSFRVIGFVSQMAYDCKVLAWVR
jgi:hypothetical protein